MKKNCTQRPLWLSMVAIMLAFFMTATSLGGTQVIESLAKYTTSLSVGTITLNVVPGPVILMHGYDNNNASNPDTLYNIITAANKKTAITEIYFGSRDKYSSEIAGLTGEPVDADRKGLINLYQNGSKVYIISESNRPIASNTNFERVFYQLTSLKKVNFSNDFYTSRTQSFHYMCYGSKNLAEINVGMFNTSNATNINDMFYLNLDSGGVNTALKTLDVANWDVSNVQRAGSVFRCLAGLTSLDLSGWNLTNAWDMGGMFEYCTGLTSLDLRGFSSAGMTNPLPGAVVSGKEPTCTLMFNGCSNLRTIYTDYDFDCRTIASNTNMFGGCTSLVGGSGTTYNDMKAATAPTDNADHYSDNTYATVDLKHSGSSSLVHKSVPGYFTYYVSSGSNQAPLPAGKANTNGVLDDYPNATSIIFGTKAEYAAAIGSAQGKNFTHDGSEDIKLYNVGNTIYILSDKLMLFSSASDYFFTALTKLKSVHFDNVSTAAVTTFQAFFDGCTSLESITFGSNVNFDTSSANDFGGFIRNCPKLSTATVQTLVGHIDVSSAEDLGGFFDGCTGLTGTLNLSHWYTPNNTTLLETFNDTRLSVINISGMVVTDKLKRAGYCFANNPNLTTIYTSIDFDISKADLEAAHKSDLFTGCTNLVGTFDDGEKEYKTTYSASHDLDYARPQTHEQNGYFTPVVSAAFLLLLEDELVSDSDVTTTATSGEEETTTAAATTTTSTAAAGSTSTAAPATTTTTTAATTAASAGDTATTTASSDSTAADSTSTATAADSTTTTATATAATTTTTANGAEETTTTTTATSATSATSSTTTTTTTAPAVG